MPRKMNTNLSIVSIFLLYQTTTYRAGNIVVLAVVVILTMLFLQIKID